MTLKKKSPIMSDVNVYVYQANNCPKLNKIYVKGHTQVLIDYGVKMVTSRKPTWINHNKTHCIVAIDSDNEMVGGIRIQIADWIKPLPMEVAISPLDEGIHDLVRKQKDIGVGELCGLWNSKKVAGKGLSYALTRAAVAYVEELSFEILMGICAEYSLGMFQSVGFEVDKSLGNNGEFPYPTEKYITQVVGILNAKKLKSASPEEKKLILELRKNLDISREEHGKSGSLKLKYNLKNECSDHILDII